jgi:16S rRNA (uracil1498-N3)-methyltransferase
VGTPLSFAEALREAAATCERILFCYEEERERSLRQAVTAAMEDGVSSLAVFVGSEGGFSPEEALRAKEAGFLMASLGPRILRCETAPDYALSAISYRFEL